MWRETLRDPRITAVLGGAVGAIAATFISARVLRAKYEAIADEEVASVKEHYSLLRKENVSLEEMASQYEDRPIIDEILPPVVAETLRTYQGIPPEQEVVITQETSVTKKNIFQGEEVAEFDYDTEKLKRESMDPHDPYIITKEEFEHGELDYEQTTLTWYDGDDVLADARDEAIPNVDHIIGGIENLQFGYGSGDRHIVYIRSPRLQMEWEIVLHEGKFAVDVLGFDDDELRHSDRRIRKFRTDD